MSALDDLRFAMIALDNARRTLFVRPEDQASAELIVDDAGVAGLIKIVTSPYVPAGSFFVVDEQAIEAMTREAIQSIGRRPIRG